MNSSANKTLYSQAKAIFDEHVKKDIKEHQDLLNKSTTFFYKAKYINEIEYLKSLQFKKYDPKEDYDNFIKTNNNVINYYDSFADHEKEQPQPLFFYEYDIKPDFGIIQKFWNFHTPGELDNQHKYSNPQTFFKELDQEIKKLKKKDIKQKDRMLDFLNKLKNNFETICEPQEAKIR